MAQLFSLNSGQWVSFRRDGFFLHGESGLDVNEENSLVYETTIRSSIISIFSGNNKKTLLNDFLNCSRFLFDFSQNEYSAPFPINSGKSFYKNNEIFFGRVVSNRIELHNTHGELSRLTNLNFSGNNPSAVIDNNRNLSIMTIGHYIFEVDTENGELILRNEEEAEGEAFLEYSEDFGFVVLNDDVIKASKDGQNWTVIPHNLEGNINSFVYGNGIFLVSISDSVYKIVDLFSGEFEEVNISSTNIGLLNFEDGFFIANPRNVIPRLPYYSNDAINWSEAVDSLNTRNMFYLPESINGSYPFDAAEVEYTAYGSNEPLEYSVEAMEAAEQVDDSYTAEVEDGYAYLPRRWDRNEESYDYYYLRAKTADSDDIIWSSDGFIKKIDHNVSITSDKYRTNNGETINMRVTSNISNNVGESIINYSLYRTEEQPEGEELPSEAVREISINSYVDEDIIRRTMSTQVSPRKDSWYTWLVTIYENDANNRYQSAWNDPALTTFVDMEDDGSNEPIEYRIIEAEFIKFLISKGYNAAPLAPAKSEGIQEEYVTVTRLTGDTDIRNRHNSSIIVIDCFIPSPEITGRDRFDAARLAYRVRDDLLPFMRNHGWIRRIEDVSVNDSSDDRWTYYTVSVTFTEDI